MCDMRSRYGVVHGHDHGNDAFNATFDPQNCDGTMENAKVSFDAKLRQYACLPTSEPGVATAESV